MCKLSVHQIWSVVDSDPVQQKYSRKLSKQQCNECVLDKLYVYDICKQYFCG